MVVDSGLQDIMALPMVSALVGLGSSAASFPAAPFDSLASASAITVPVLIHHSEADSIVPYAQAASLHAALQTKDKTLHRWPPPCGHNDIAVHNQNELARLLRGFVARVCLPPLDAAALASLSVKELKARAAARGLDTAGCLYKEDMVALLLR